MPVVEIVDVDTFISMIGSQGNQSGLGLIRYYDSGDSVIIYFTHSNTEFKLVLDKISLVEERDMTFDDFFNQYLFPLSGRVIRLVGIEMPESSKNTVEIKLSGDFEVVKDGTTEGHPEEGTD